MPCAVNTDSVSDGVFFCQELAVGKIVQMVQSPVAAFTGQLSHIPELADNIVLGISYVGIPRCFEY